MSKFLNVAKKITDLCRALDPHSFEMTSLVNKYGAKNAIHANQFLSTKKGETLFVPNL